jgi:hypothetical protein
VNLRSKSLIFFLNILVASHALSSTTGVAAATGLSAGAVSLRKKSAGARLEKYMTKARLPVRVIWQVLRSQGQGAMMNTSAETFSADGLIHQVSSARWELKIGKTSVIGTLILSKLGQDGRFVARRSEVLSMLGVESPLRDQLSEDPSEEDIAADVVQIPLFATPSRQLETIYRGPEEELFLVKLAVSIPSS